MKRWIAALLAVVILAGSNVTTYNVTKQSVASKMYTQEQLEEQYTEGFNDGGDDGYEKGYAEGKSAGHDKGYAEGKDVGYKKGYKAGIRHQKEKQRKAEEEAAAQSAAVSETAETNADTEQTVYITSTGSKYHRAGCQYLRQSQQAISKADAAASGYTPCSVCNP